MAQENFEGFDFDPNKPDCSDGDFYCKICDASMNSEAMWSSHIVGKKHIKKVLQGPRVIYKRKLEDNEEDDCDVPPKIERFDTGGDPNVWRPAVDHPEYYPNNWNEDYMHDGTHIRSSTETYIKPFSMERNIDRFPPVYGPRNFDEGPPRPWDERDLEQRPYLYKPTQSYDYGHTKSLNDPDPVSSTVFDMPSSSSLPFKKDIVDSLLFEDIINDIIAIRKAKDVKAGDKTPLQITKDSAGEVKEICDDNDSQQRIKDDKVLRNKTDDEHLHPKDKDKITDQRANSKDNSNKNLHQSNDRDIHQRNTNKSTCEKNDDKSIHKKDDNKSVHKKDDSKSSHQKDNADKASRYKDDGRSSHSRNDDRPSRYRDDDRSFRSRDNDRDRNLRDRRSRSKDRKSPRRSRERKSPRRSRERKSPRRSRERKSPRRSRERRSPRRSKEKESSSRKNDDDRSSRQRNRESKSQRDSKERSSCTKSSSGKPSRDNSSSGKNKRRRITDSESSSDDSDSSSSADSSSSSEDEKVVKKKFSNGKVLQLRINSSASHGKSVRVEKDDNEEYEKELLELLKQYGDDDIVLLENDEKKTNTEEKNISSGKQSSNKRKLKLDEVDPERLSPNQLDSLLSSYLEPKANDQQKVKKNSEDIVSSLDDLTTKTFLKAVLRRVDTLRVQDMEELNMLSEIIVKSQSVICNKLPSHLQAEIKKKMSERKEEKEMNKNSPIMVNNPVISQNPASQNLPGLTPIAETTPNFSEMAAQLSQNRRGNCGSMQPQSSVSQNSLLAQNCSTNNSSLQNKFELPTAIKNNPMLLSLFQKKQESIPGLQSSPGNDTQVPNHLTSAAQNILHKIFNTQMSSPKPNPQMQLPSQQHYTGQNCPPRPRLQLSNQQYATLQNNPLFSMFLNKSSTSLSEQKNSSSLHSSFNQPPPTAQNNQSSFPKLHKITSSSHEQKSPSLNNLQMQSFNKPVNSTNKPPTSILRKQATLSEQKTSSTNTSNLKSTNWLPSAKEKNSLSASSHQPVQYNKLPVTVKKIDQTNAFKNESASGISDSTISNLTSKMISALVSKNVLPPNALDPHIRGKISNFISQKLKASVNSTDMNSASSSSDSKGFENSLLQFDLDDDKLWENYFMK